MLVNTVETHFGGHVALAHVSLAEIEKRGFSPETMETVPAQTAFLMRSVAGWDICIAMMETGKDRVKVSFRTRDENTYDLSKAAQYVGGNGHRGAAGAVIRAPLSIAKEKVLEALRVMYPELSSFSIQ
jgi:nanoRNase/pAp phosphatase (c-di-AMP/oligoRNAs hydrolase)